MTKKLVTILAEELPEWPEGGVASIGQACDGTLHFDGKRGQFMRHSNLAYTMCEDIHADNVTRAQWEAERARILRESQPERDPVIKEIVEDVSVGYRMEEAFYTDGESLWDKVAIAAMPAVIRMEYTMADEAKMVEYAARYADAFMAERAKAHEGVMMEKKRCRHERNSWVYVHGLSAVEWCYCCGAIRQLAKSGEASFSAMGKWQKPVGIGGKNPALKDGK